MTSGVGLIQAERKRQLEEEGWSSSHDDFHDEDELAIAGATYALPDYHRNNCFGIPLLWPWKNKWWKPTPENRIRELTKAGALIAAEIDRLLRQERDEK